MRGELADACAAGAVVKLLDDAGGTDGEKSDEE